jgi:hypothetical protein
MCAKCAPALADHNRMAKHADLMAMGQTTLAKYIHRRFSSPKLDTVEAYNLRLAGYVWHERFGHFPTIGEISVFVS